MRRVCVFCGSSHGVRPAYAAAARTLGRLLVERGLGLVYGGGNVGLMGVMADAVLEAGGEVLGVIPHALMAREIGHPGVTEMHVVDSMHERKALMADRADAFIALPGGVGTFEELFEAITWTQLGLHAKPCGLLNVDGFYDDLLRLPRSRLGRGLHQARDAGDREGERRSWRAARPARAARRCRRCRAGSPARPLGRCVRAAPSSGPKARQ